MKWDSQRIEEWLAWAINTTDADAFAAELRSVPTEDWALVETRLSVALNEPVAGEPQAEQLYPGVPISNTNLMGGPGQMAGSARLTKIDYLRREDRRRRERR